MKTRGFCTIATGGVHYFRLASNLLCSYRQTTADALPFAIMTDKENSFTKEFDKVVVMNNVTCSYMDKIEMLAHPPFDETIFIDADCLAYGDLNCFFRFIDEIGYNSGVRTFGRCYPLGSPYGWYKQGNLGEYEKLVDCQINMHGGVIYFKDDTTTRKIYDECIAISRHYSEFKFAMFDKPADEPIMALAMAVHSCMPIELRESQDVGGTFFVFYPAQRRVQMNYSKRLCRYTNNGEEWVSNVLLLHWMNHNTLRVRYRREVSRMRDGEENVQGKIKYTALLLMESLTDFKHHLCTRLYQFLKP